MIEFEQVYAKLMTRELCAEHSTMAHVPAERAIKRERMKWLNDRLKARDFGTPYWVVARLRSTGKLYRVDGQHTSTLLSQCPDELFPAGLMVIVSVYIIDDLETDGATLFERFNHPKSARTNLDKLHTFRTRFDDELGEMSDEFLSKAVNGYHFHLKITPVKRGYKPKLWEPREVGHYLAEPNLRTFAKWLYQWDRSIHSWMTSKRGIVAVAYVNWKTSPKVATTFWGHVFNEDGDPNDPSRQLSRELNKWRLSKDNKEPKLYHRKAFNAWTEYGK